MGNLPPVKIKLFRQFLKTKGLEKSRIKGDHEIWTKNGLLKPVTFPNKKKEIFGRVIKSNLNTLGVSTDDFYDYIRGIN